MSRISKANMVDGARDYRLMTRKFVDAVLYYDTEAKLSDVHIKWMSLISEDYKNIYHYFSKGCSEEEKLYLRLLLVTDYVCGMTDSYAKNLYQELKGII